jgi:hypothetical protein
VCERQLLGSFGNVQRPRPLAVFGGRIIFCQSDNIAHQLKGVIKQAEELLPSSGRRHLWKAFV